MRKTFVIVGTVLVFLAGVAWLAPVVGGDDAALVERTVETKTGGVTVTEKRIGWGAVHSDSVMLALLGPAVVLIAVGVLPAGSVKSITTVFGSVEFTETAMKQVLTEAAAKAPAEQTVDVYERALASLRDEYGAQRGRVTLTPDAVADAVERAISDDD